MGTVDVGRGAFCFIVLFWGDEHDVDWELGIYWIFEGCGLVCLAMGGFCGQGECVVGWRLLIPGPDASELEIWKVTYVVVFGVFWGRVLNRYQLYHWYHDM